MSNDLIAALTQGHMPAVLQQAAGGDELTGGIAPSFGVVSIRGKVFRIKHNGNEYPLYYPADPSRNIPANTIPYPFLDVIIVKAAPVISKNFYPGGYTPGSDEAPVCSSADGITSDASATQRQSVACATCPQNAWGSKVMADGTKLKACQDVKRLAVVPAADHRNEGWGGPMLLRVPPGSLKALTSFQDQLKTVNAKYFGVVTRISFADSEYPQLVFQALRFVTDEQAHDVIAMQQSDQIKRILAEVVAPAQPTPAIAPPVVAAPVVAPPVVAPPVVAAPVVAAPVVAPPVVAPPVVAAPVVAAPVVAPPVVAAPVVAAPVAQQATPAEDSVDALLAQLRAKGVDTSAMEGGTQRRQRRPRAPSPAPTPEAATVQPIVTQPQPIMGAPTPAAVDPAVASVQADIERLLNS